MNFFAPGGIGAVAFEEWRKKSVPGLAGLSLAEARLTGSILGTLAWTSVQLMGYIIAATYSLNLIAGNNPFEGPKYVPLNLLLGSVWAPLSPYLVEKVIAVLKGER